MKKLKKIMLIDDSESDNFVHSRVIRKMDITEEIVVRYNGETALKYLTTVIESKFPKPELIFLDINMPGMNGWEFLDEYHKLPENQKADIVVCMLTTSENVDDEQKAKGYNSISSYNHKPLTKEMLENILAEHKLLMTNKE